MKTQPLKNMAVLVFACLCWFCSCKKDPVNMPAPAPQLTVPPQASFVYNISPGKAPVVVTFVSTSSNATSITWDLGDGELSDAQVVKKEYASGGIHDIKLTASGPGGVATKTQRIEIPAEAKSLTIRSFSVTGIRVGDFDLEPVEDAAPDLYFKITDPVKAGELFTSKVAFNVTMLPLTWSTNIGLDFAGNPGKQFLIQLWDLDIINAPDLIDELYLIPANYMTLEDHYPSEIILAKGLTTVKLLVEWQ